MKITKEWLKSHGFKKQPKDTFKNINLPYWVKNGICLFFNEDQPYYSFYIGYGFSFYDAKGYYAATFRWTNQIDQVELIYKAIIGLDLEKL